MSQMRDETHPDYVGACEGCNTPLFVGDTGMRCDDGPVLCGECALTWKDVKAQWDADEMLDDDPERRAAFMASYQAHLAGGGSADDKLSYQL